MIDTTAYIIKLRAEHHNEVDEMFGERDEYSCGGGWSFSGPPCGGCVDCAHGMVAYQWQKHLDMDAQAKRVGLKGALTMLIDHELIYKDPDTGAYRNYTTDASYSFALSPKQPGVTYRTDAWGMSGDHKIIYKEGYGP